MTGRSLVGGIIAAIGVFGIAVVVWKYRQAATTFASAAVLAGVLLVLVGLVGWWVLAQIRPIRSAPWARGLACIAWGAIGATGCAILANDGQNTFLTRTAGVEFASRWGAAVSAPINEEILKAAGLVLLSLALAGLVRGPMEGFVYGSLIGLGFQILENWIYAVNGVIQAGAVDPVSSVLSTLLTRVVLTGLGSHWTMSAVAGAGVGYLVASRGSRRRVLAGVGLFLLAMLMHASFDAPVLEGAIVVKTLVNFAIAMIIYGTLRHRLRAAARAELDGDRRSALLTRLGRRRELHRLSLHDGRAAAAQAQRERLDQLEERAYAAA